MPSKSPSEVSVLLDAVGRGEPEASGRLLDVVYGELRAMAHRAVQGERGSATLEPTALVHEAFVRLLGDKAVAWNGRAHFFGAAAQAMRRMLVDRARRAGRQKRGGGRKPLTIDDQVVAPEERSEEVLALDQALGELEKLDARKADVVCLRFFGGLSVVEVARVLEVSEATVKDDWSFARAWLKSRLAREVPED